jgi:DNA polymerase III delta subunit
MRAYIGVDEKKKRKSRSLFESEVDVVSVYDADTFERSKLMQDLSVKGMFGEKRGVVCLRVFEDKASAEELFVCVEQLGNETPLLILEDSLDKKEIEKLKKGGVVVEHDPPIKKVEFSPFRLTDAVASRNTKDAWVEWHRARSQGQSAEYLISMIAWQLRSLLVVKHIPQHESDMKPFTFNKSQRAGERWRQEELEKLSQECAGILVRVRSEDGLSVDALTENLLLSLK